MPDESSEMVPVPSSVGKMDKWREKVRGRTVSAVKAQLAAQKLMPKAVEALGSILENEELDEKGRRVVSAGEQVAAARLVSDIAAQSELLAGLLDVKKGSEPAGPKTVVNILNYADGMTDEEKAIIQRLALRRLRDASA